MLNLRCLGRCITDGLFVALSGTRSTRTASCGCSWFAMRAWNWQSSWWGKSKVVKRRMMMTTTTLARLRKNAQGQLPPSCRWNWEGCCWRSRGLRSPRPASRRTIGKRACCTFSLESCPKQRRTRMLLSRWIDCYSPAYTSFTWLGILLSAVQFHRWAFNGGWRRLIMSKNV